MAFKYIEEVQSGLKDFIDDIEPEIIYFDEYGIVGDAYPHYYSMKKISQAYKQLKELLPEDYGRIDE
jgi:alpha-L-fucosidase